MKKKGEFRAQQERHRKRQALWDGIKKLRAGEETQLEISGKVVNARPLPEDILSHVEENLSTGEYLYIIEFRKGKLVLAALTTKDCHLRAHTVHAGNVDLEALSKRLQRKHILGCCKVR